MTFLDPARLWLLLAVAALVAGYVLAQRRRRRAAVRFPNTRLLAAILPRRTAWRRHLPAAAALLAVTAGVLGLAHPATQHRVPRNGAIMLAIDTSGSMVATDVTPTRLKAAVSAAQSFVAGAPAQLRIGLVTFTDRATVLATPTTDRAAVRGALGTLTRGPGTAAGEGLYAALGALGNVSDATSGGKPPAAIVLLADGASTVGRPLESAAQAASDAGIPVDTVAFGTDHGTVEIGGRTVPVPVETGALRAVAGATGGSFFTASSAAQLRSVYDEVGRGVGFETRYREYLPLLTGVAVALLFAAAVMGLLWMPRLA